MILEPKQKYAKLVDIAKKYDIKIIVETGTYLGGMIHTNMNYFDELYSIELSKYLYENAVLMFENINKVHLYHGDSTDILPKILPEINSRAIFWLDGHYSEGITVKGKKETPIIEELTEIFKRSFQDIIVIDDARCFNGTHDYPSKEELYYFINSHGKDVYYSEDMFIIF